jgi:hypothetical protein
MQVGVPDQVHPAPQPQCPLCMQHAGGACSCSAADAVGAQRMPPEAAGGTGQAAAGKGFGGAADGCGAGAVPTRRSGAGAQVGVRMQD